ncbi:hypothetical protein FBY23_1950 [Nocardioides sp. SLBN-35]|nr:hypothetical protein FBY23_1950 [Nocardioides sp. SLBN-35]
MATVSRRPENAGHAPHKENPEMKTRKILAATAAALAATLAVSLGAPASNGSVVMATRPGGCC